VKITALTLPRWRAGPSLSRGTGEGLEKPLARIAGEGGARVFAGG